MYLFTYFASFFSRFHQSTNRQADHVQTAGEKLKAGQPNSHHHHQSLNHEGRWGTTDDFATSFLHFPLFSTALWGFANPRSVHSLMLSSHLFLCLLFLLRPFTVPCKMALARPDEQENQTLPTVKRITVVDTLDDFRFSAE